ncbi:uncharacterized protein LOC112092646 [Morus notabilis]|uniref:uncharacterized protein LOC112092646 n=1 Tax=Morus notabilis TaxID=981085 RepID=UPI000CED06D9|nr:uncharacterized protein LOC112092646 [Morus notabilis]
MAPRRRPANQPAQQNQGFLDAMYAAFQGMATRARNERPVEDKKQGEGGPQEAELWLDYIVKHLSTIGVPDEYWVEFAVYKMVGLANTWWKQVKRIIDVTGLTWEQFETLFNEQYFPQSYREEKALEFMSLLQGDMSIREYESKFNDLSRFAPSLVESEPMSCLKFEKGLKNSVRRSLVALRIQNFRDLVAAATGWNRVDHSGVVGETATNDKRLRRWQAVAVVRPEVTEMLRTGPGVTIVGRGKGKVQRQAYALAGGSSGGQTSNAVVEEYGVIVDCYRRRVTLMTKSGTSISYQADLNPVLGERLLKYSVRGRRNLACFSSLLALEGKLEVIGDSAGIPVVDEFADIFPDELPGLPPDREIEFYIDLIPGTAPISIPPYRMALAEMKELRTQLEELAKKGYIQNRQGISVDSSKIETVLQWEKPKNVVEIRSFLRLTGN